MLSILSILLISGRAVVKEKRPSAVTSSYFSSCRFFAYSLQSCELIKGKKVHMDALRRSHNNFQINSLKPIKSKLTEFDSHGLDKRIKIGLYNADHKHYASLQMMFAGFFTASLVISLLEAVERKKTSSDFDISRLSIALFNGALCLTFTLYYSLRLSLLTCKKV